jgi:hypothetical protein
LALQLFEDLLDGDSIEYVFSGSREDGEDGEGAVFLVLFKAPSQAVVALVAVISGATYRVAAYFSFAMRSSPMRCLASDSFPKTYCPAR